MTVRPALASARLEPARPGDVVARTRGSERLRQALPWLLGALIVVAAVIPLIRTHLLNPWDDQRLVDLEVYREAGLSVVMGRPIYDWLSPVPQLLPFTYPPFAALLAVPLVLAPLGLWQWLWTVSQLVLLAGITAVCFRPLLRRGGRWWPALAGALTALMLWLLPLRDQIKFGQVNLILVALVLADLLVRHPRWPRGILVGAATAIKLTPGIFVVYLWFAGRRRAAVTAAVTAAALTAVTFILLPADTVDFWFGALLESSRLGANDGTSNQSVRGMLLRLGPQGLLGTALWLALAIAIAGYGLRLAIRASRDGQELAAIAAVGLVAVLVSPVAWIHHLAWLVPVLAVVVGSGRDRARLVVAAAIWAYFTLRTPWWGSEMLEPVGDGPQWLGRMLQQSFGVATLALLPLMSWVIRREQRSRVAADWGLTPTAVARQASPTR